MKGWEAEWSNSKKKKKKKSLHHIEIDVDNICQWQNGLIQMESHNTPYWPCNIFDSSVFV